MTYLKPRKPRRATRPPLPVLFITTSMPIGGAETLLVNLVRRLDRNRFLPEVCCLKERGPLGEELAEEVPVFSGLLRHKLDLRVLGRLVRLLRARRTAAVITVGAGDKMFWGRLAAWRARVPVVLSALHSTGWPDTITWLNRKLTPITDGFIAVAEPHGKFLIEHEQFPPEKICVIPNGVDTHRFRPRPALKHEVRSELAIPADAPVCGIVAALRPEKNHALFLRAAAITRQFLPTAHFVIVGDGPERAPLEALAAELQLGSCIHFTGSRSDIPRLLAALDVFTLTSHMEANPVSILEAMATGLPVVATEVGSVGESVQPGITGYLAEPGNAEEISSLCLQLLMHPEMAESFGRRARAFVQERASLTRMVRGYEDLIDGVYDRSSATQHRRQPIPVAESGEPAPVFSLKGRGPGPGVGKEL